MTNQHTLTCEACRHGECDGGCRHPEDCTGCGYCSHCTCGRCDACLGFDVEKAQREYTRCDDCDEVKLCRLSGPDGMPAVLALCEDCGG